jgi:hypothetical protein
MRFDRTPTNPNKYIWSTYLRRPTIENNLLQFLMAKLFSAILMLGRHTLALRKRPTARKFLPSDSFRNDLFKNW